ncbi:hypothetical protein FA95DRAFT_832330 [Auriscalpium vulgare]|uniref:Uncharacterized protein n=1 Tax=Auriscalpium vulgare TaxID=40419 RepID=A0ACB8S0B3_9AGAM|nr:hypothetical protein FA95DRAFT_832330 [Auriscalpium vulgare]
MMASLPSFVELMSSLGLEDEASHPRLSSACGRARSLSSASSSSFQEEEYAPSRALGQYLLVPVRYDPHDRAGDPDASIPRVSRHVKGRYSPYSAASIPRKGSLPVIHSDADSNRRPQRAISSSPLNFTAPPSQRAVWVTRPSRSGQSSRRGSQTWSKESDQDSVTPISSFLRRKSPNGSPSTSPTSPSFPRSIDIPLAPVAIPALPTLLAPFLASSASPDKLAGGSPKMSSDSNPSRSRSTSHSLPIHVQN